MGEQRIRPAGIAVTSGGAGDNQHVPPERASVAPIVMADLAEPAEAPLCRAAAYLSDGKKARRRGCQDAPPASATAECTRSIRQADAVGPSDKPTLRASAFTSPMVCSTMSEVGGIASVFVVRDPIGRFRVSSVRAAPCLRRSQEVGGVSAMTLRSAETLELLALPKLALVHRSRRLARLRG